MPVVPGGEPMVEKSMDPACMAVRMSAPEVNSIQDTSMSGYSFSSAPVSFTSSSALGDSQ